MKDREFKKVLKEEEKIRKELLDTVFESMENYKEKFMKDEKALEKNKIDEIKYKTTIKELSDYIEIYKRKIDELQEENEKINDEVISLRKKVLRLETTSSSSISILEILIKEYGIEQIAQITKLNEKNILKLIEKDNLQK